MLYTYNYIHQEMTFYVSMHCVMLIGMPLLTNQQAFRYKALIIYRGYN